MTDDSNKTYGNHDVLDEWNQPRTPDTISFAASTDAGAGLKTNASRPGITFNKKAAEKSASSAAGYGDQNFIAQFLINILMLLAGVLDPDNKDNDKLIGMISKAFGMEDDGSHTQFRQMREDIQTRGKNTVRDGMDYSKFDRKTALSAAQMGEPILGKNIYNSQMLELIGKGESGGDYNIVNSKAQRGLALPKPLTDMTINEVIEWQRAESGRQRASGDKAPSSAAGKYQFIRATLEDTASRMGLSGNEKFDQPMQDKLAMNLLNQSGYKAFMEGRKSEEKMIAGVAGTWSSVADLNGKSAHAGIGNNAASISISRTIAAAQMDKNILSPGFNEAGTGAPPKPPAADNPVIAQGPVATDAAPARRTTTPFIAGITPL